MIAFWTIVHGLLAMVLLGAISHQGFSVWRKPAPARNMFERFRAVNPMGYANTVVILYFVTFVIGSLVYPIFVLDVKGTIADFGMRYTIGLFQIKEHVAVIGLLLLPVYWTYWRNASPENLGTRRFLTTTIMVSTWWNLIVGHILNNVKGLI